MAEYDAAALPERQPGLAMLLPTRLTSLVACAAGIILGLAAVLLAGHCEPVFPFLGRAVGPRFTHSVRALGACVDPRAVLSLSGWMSQMLLVAAAAVALAVRSMRRHRRDDYSGRYRAWGWLAWLLVGASCAAQVPLGRAVGIFMVEATGIAFGPAGYGWWIAIAALLLGGVSLWAVVPLHERLATSVWLVAALGAWALSAAATWLAGDPRVPAGVAPAAWVAGSGLVAIALLVAARSVIREVRGEAGRVGRPAGRPAPVELARPVESAAAESAGAGDGDVHESPEWPSAESPAGGYTDGSDVDEERQTRHLSKAERKRLKRLARMNRAA